MYKYNNSTQWIMIQRGLINDKGHKLFDETFWNRIPPLFWKRSILYLFQMLNTQNAYSKYCQMHFYYTSKWQSYYIFNFYSLIRLNKPKPGLHEDYAKSQLFPVQFCFCIINPGLNLIQSQVWTRSKPGLVCRLLWHIFILFSIQLKVTS